MIRWVLSFIILACLSCGAFAQCTVTGPQGIAPPAVASGVDENCLLTGRQIGANEVVSPFPFSTTAATNAPIGFGQMQVYLDNPNGFAVNQVVQVWYDADPEIYIIGVIVALDPNFYLATINAIVPYRGAAIISGILNIQVLNGSGLNGVPNWAGLSVDGTTALTNPATQGTVVNLTVEPGKAFTTFSTVYVWAPEDITTWLVGVVISYNPTTGAISIFCTQTPNTGLTYQTNYVSLIGTGGPAPVLTGYSSTPLTFGLSAGQIGVGQAVTLTTQTGLLLNGSNIVVSSSADSSQYFRGIGQYNKATGAITVYITDASGSGTFGAWSLFAQDGPPINASQFAVSTTAVTLGAGDLLFTIQAGQNFPLGGPVTLTALAAPNNQMLGSIKAYSGATLIVNVTADGVFGSGTFSTWSILNTGPPQPSPLPIYNALGSRVTSPHAVTDVATLSGGSATVNLSGPAAYATATTYVVVATDTTTNAAVKAHNVSGSQFTLTGTGSDTVSYIAMSAIPAAALCLGTLDLSTGCARPPLRGL